MKFYYAAALVLGVTLTSNAQGYKDGIEYYKAGQFDNAITILDRNLNSSGTDKALANYYLGQSYLNKNEIAKAKTYFDAGINANPDCGYNYVGLGAIELKQNNKNEAQNYFKKALSLAKKNNEILVDIARAYYNANPDTYKKEIEEYLGKARKNSKNQEPAIYIFEGDRETQNGNINEAATWYEQAILFDSDNPEGYVKYANTYIAKAPQFAISKLEELLQLQPNSALAQRERAEKYYENGQSTRAAAQYGKYIENPNHFPQDKARYAVLLFADSKFDDAIKTAKEVLKDTPNDLTLKRIIFRSMLETASKEDALQNANEFFANPEFKGRYNAGDYQSYAQFLIENEMLPEAEEVLMNGKAAFPKDGTILKMLADAQSNQKKNIDAFETYNLYLVNEENPSARDYNTGSMYALNAVTDTQDNDELRNKYAGLGLDYLNKIIDPEKPRADYLLRRLQIILNQNLGIVTDEGAEAINALLAALDTEPENSNPANPNNSLKVYRILYNQLSSYYEKKGNKEAAKDAKEKMQYYSSLIEN